MVGDEAMESIAQISDEGLALLFKLPNLWQLSVHGCELSEKAVAKFDRHPTLFRCCRTSLLLSLIVLAIGCNSKSSSNDPPLTQTFSEAQMSETVDPELELFKSLVLEKQLAFLAKLKSKTSEFDAQSHLYKYLGEFPLHAIDSELRALFLLAKNNKTYLVRLDDGEWQQIPVEPFDDLKYFGRDEDDCAIFIAKRETKTYEAMIYGFVSEQFAGVFIGEILEKEFELNQGNWPEGWEKPSF